MTNATTPIRQRPPGAKMTIEVYTISRTGVVSAPRATVSVPYGYEPELESLNTAAALRLPSPSTGGRPMNATRDETEAPAASIVAMRAAAGWFLDQPSLPRHQTVKGFSEDFHGYLDQLIPQIKQLTERLSEDDVPAKVAQAGAGEARRRLDEPEADGLHGAVERVKQLARSVVALCDHYETLKGVTTCLTCDTPIEDGEERLPYDQVSPSGGAARSGHIHARCANTVRRTCR